MLKFKNYITFCLLLFVVVTVLISAPKQFECVKTGHPATITNSSGNNETTCGDNHDLCCVAKLVDSHNNNIYHQNDRLSVFIYDDNNSNFGKGYKNVIANSLIDLNLPVINLDITMDGSSQSFTDYNMWKNACEN